MAHETRQYLTALLAILPTAFALKNGLAITPQMGWNDWNAYGCGIDQDLVTTTASSMKKYHYVNMDDCWAESSRNSSGYLVANSTKFPNGIPYLTNYVHSLGFQFGMYSDAGNETCAGYPGSLGNEQKDADTFASWGVDYLKYDNCNNNGLTSKKQTIARYKAMGNALNSTGRPFLYSLCEWGLNDPWLWAGNVGNSWRISGDISDNWNTYESSCALPAYGGYQCSAVRIAAFAGSQLAKYGAPGGWNDLDMLEVGNGAMTDAEEVAHFSLWSMMKSPLIIGTNVANISSSSFSVLMNPALIAINQDPLGMPAALRVNSSTYQVYSGPLQSTTGGKYQDYVVGIINLASTAQNISVSAKMIFHGTAPTSTYTVYDLWANRLTSSEAEGILSNGAAAHKNLIYNSTQTSYAQGLAKGNSLLLGQQVGNLRSPGRLAAQVPSNAGVFYRLRASGQQSY